MAQQYKKDFKDREVRLLDDHLAANPDSTVWSGVKTVATKLGISPHTLRGWRKQASGTRQGDTSAFFRSGARSTRPQMICFITEYKDRFGLEENFGVYGVWWFSEVGFPPPEYALP